MSERKDELIKECLRASETCLYTSTSFYLWLKSVKTWNNIFVVAPIIIGGVAGFGLVEQSAPSWVAASLVLLSGFFPAVFDALKLKGQADQIEKYAAQYKILQGRFRQAAKIAGTGSVEELEAEFRGLSDRLDAARSAGLIAPHRFFDEARKQIKGGNYDYTLDEVAKDTSLLNRAHPFT